MYEKTPNRQEESVSRGVAVLGAGLALVVGFFLGFTLHGMLAGSPAPVVETAPNQAAAPSAPQVGSGMAGRIQTMERKVQLEPANAEAWTQLGNLYFDSKQPQKAIAAYSRSLTLKPHDPNVLTDQGVMYRQMGDFDRALDCFNKAIAINPAHVIAQFNKSVVLEHDKHDKAGALSALRDLASRNPNAILPGGSTVSQAIRELSGR